MPKKKKIEIHELALLYPDMEKGTFKDLKASIKKNGLMLMCVTLLCNF
jgi:hypothetical protein